MTNESQTSNNGQAKLSDATHILADVAEGVGNILLDVSIAYEEEGDKGASNKAWILSHALLSACEDYCKTVEAVEVSA